MGWTDRFRRPCVTADVGAGFLALEATAHQGAIEATAGTGRSRGAAQRLPVDLTVHAERGGVVALAWHNRNVGLAPPRAREHLAAQVGAAGRARVVVSGEVFRQDGLWRVWVGPLPRPGDLAVPQDTVAAKPPTIAGIPLQRSDGGDS